MTSDGVLGQSLLKVLKISEEYTLRDLLETQQVMVLRIFQINKIIDLILHVDFSLIQRETGYITGLVCVLHDVTEQQKNEREQREFRFKCFSRIADTIDECSELHRSP